jgi:predicted MFS family arabinose efflux permease
LSRRHFQALLSPDPLDAATALAGAALIALYVPESRPAGHVTGGGDGAWTFNGVLRDTRFALLLAASLALGMIVVQTASSVALVMSADAIDEEQFGRLIAVNGMLIALTQPWLVPRLERAGRYRVMPWAALLLGAGFASHALADGATTHLLAIAAWTMGEVALFPLCNAAAADLAPERNRGRYMGAYWLAWTGSHVAGPLLGLLVLGRLGEGVWGASLAALGLLASLALRRVGPRAAVQAAERSSEAGRESTDSSTV